MRRRPRAFAKRHNGQRGARTRGQQRPAQGAYTVGMCLCVSHPRSSSCVCSPRIRSAVFLSGFGRLLRNTSSISRLRSVSSARCSASPGRLGSCSPESLPPTPLRAMTPPRSCRGVYLCPSFLPVESSP